MAATRWPTPKFQESLKNCFVKVGICCPHAYDDHQVPLFHAYQLGSRLGKITKPLSKEVKAAEKAAKKKAALPAAGEMVSEAEEEGLLVEEDVDRDFYPIAGLLVRMEIRDADADRLE